MKVLTSTVIQVRILSQHGHITYPVFSRILRMTCRWTILQMPSRVNNKMYIQNHWKPVWDVCSLPHTVYFCTGQLWVARHRLVVERHQSLTTLPLLGCETYGRKKKMVTPFMQIMPYTGATKKTSTEENDTWSPQMTHLLLTFNKSRYRLGTLASTF